jgi:hypothetical protein
MSPVAENILEQLGGRRFVAMTGACNFCYGDNGLYFSLGKGAALGINKVGIVYRSDDSYTVSFYKVSTRAGKPLKLIAEMKGVWALELAFTVSNTTGFALTLTEGESRASWTLAKAQLVTL